MPRQFGLQRGAERAGDRRALKIERHFARLRRWQILRRALIDFVAHGQQPDRHILRWRRRNRSAESTLRTNARRRTTSPAIRFDRATGAEVPAPCRYRGRRRSARTATTLPVRFARTSKSLPLNFHTSAEASSIVAASSVVISARTLGRFASSAADSGQGLFLLRLKTLIVGYGIAQVLANIFPHPLPHAIADDQQRSGGQPGGNRQKRQQKFRSQTNIAHARPPVKNRARAGESRQFPSE